MTEPFVEEMERQILEIGQCCWRCHFCITSCPAFESSQGWFTQSGAGMVKALYYGILWDELTGEERSDLREILYRCTTCGSCEIACREMSLGVKLLEAIEKGRKVLVERMIGPMPDQKNALESLAKHGNPYGELASKRLDWVGDLPARTISEDDKAEVLYFVGCTPAYDTRAQEIARSLVRILSKANVDFAIWRGEQCCGDPARRMGEEGLFQDLSEGNVRSFRKMGVKRIITTSPHCFHAFSEEYPAGMDSITVQHYTEFLSALLEEGKLKVRKPLRKKVTYQDPCYLSKHHDLCEPARKLLRSVPGLTLVEMERSKKGSLCCGGGGGRMWTDFVEEKRLSEKRAEEALEVDAEILVTSCPFCTINLEDGIKTSSLEERLVVKEMSELLAELM